MTTPARFHTLVARGGVELFGARAIRRLFTRDELKQYARLRRLKPECVVED